MFSSVSTLSLLPPCLGYHPWDGRIQGFLSQLVGLHPWPASPAQTDTLTGALHVFTLPCLANHVPRGLTSLGRIQQQRKMQGVWPPFWRLLFQHGA